MALYPPADEDGRLERLRDLSKRITDAMTEMSAFQARVNAVLRQIARDQERLMPGPRGKSAGRGARKPRRRVA
jgi:hypothetical protein